MRLSCVAVVAYRCVTELALHSNEISAQTERRAVRDRNAIRVDLFEDGVAVIAEVGLGLDLLDVGRTAAGTSKGFQRHQVTSDVGQALSEGHRARFGAVVAQELGH
jgi:hypothetical protein